MNANDISTLLDDLLSLVQHEPGCAFGGVSGQPCSCRLPDVFGRVETAIAALTGEPSTERADLLKLFEAVELAVDRIDGVDAYAQGGYRQAAREYDEARRAMKAALTGKEPQRELASSARPLLVRAIEKVRELSNWRFVEGYAAASMEDLQLVHEMEDALTREEPAKPDPVPSRGTPVSCRHRELLAELMTIARVGLDSCGHCHKLTAFAARVDALAQPCAVPCQHRELLRHLVTTLDQAPGSLPRCVPLDGGWGEWLAVLADSLGAAKAALNAAQPCAAQGDAGEWEPPSVRLKCGRCDHEWDAILARRSTDVYAVTAQRCPDPDCDEPPDEVLVYRRRAKGGGAQ